MRHSLYKLGLMALFVVLLISCNHASNVSTIHSQATSESSIVLNNSDKEEKPVSDLTHSILLSDFESIDQLFFNETLNQLWVLQRARNKKSAISIYDLNEQNNISYKIFDFYIAKIKITNSGVVCFANKSIIKLNTVLDEEYRLDIPQTAFSAQNIDISGDEKSLIYIDKTQKSIYLDTIPFTRPELVLTADDLKDAGAIFDIAFLPNELIYFSYQTLELPFGVAIIDTSGNIRIQNHLYATVPKVIDNKLFLYQGIVEPAPNNNLYIYNLDLLESQPEIIVTETVGEAASTTISNNGKYILTLQTNENGEDFHIKVYNTNNNRISMITIPNNQAIGTINPLYSANGHAISNDGTVAYILFDDDDGRKLLSVPISRSYK